MKDTVAETNVLPSVEYLRQCFRYADGKLFWLPRPRGHFLDAGRWRTQNSRDAGKEAGSWSGPPGARRRVVRLDGRLYFRHRLIWALHHAGQCPLRLDHEDRDPANDRIDNLRPATQSQNAANASLSRRNTSGYRGVHRFRGRWKASIRVNGRERHLGVFDDPAMAHAAYKDAARAAFGVYAATITQRDESDGDRCCVGN